MILHVATQRGGGAGTAAVRLHQGLRKLGQRSEFLTADAEALPEQGFHVLPRRFLPLTQRIARKFGAGLTTQERWQATTRRAEVGGVYTAGIESDLGLEQHPLLRQADVINLHWTTGVLPWQAFFSRVDCPIVWTLHDMNSFSGIYHYEVDAVNAPPSALKLDREIKDAKRKLVRDCPITIVTPSQWLMRSSQKSTIFGNLNHIHIPYGIDTDVFRSYNADFSRDILGLPKDARLLLTVAERLDNHRKGFDLLSHALKRQPLNGEWQIVTVGKGRIEDSRYPIHSMGQISDPRLMALLYSASDASVISSRQDNLPNVVLESLCCGTPVVGTPVGGIPEMIRPGINGMLAEELSEQSVADALGQLDRIDFDRSAIEADAQQTFCLTKQAAAYQQLYARLSHSAGAGAISQQRRSD